MKKILLAMATMGFLAAAPVAASAAMPVAPMQGMTEKVADAVQVQYRHHRGGYGHRGFHRGHRGWNHGGYHRGHRGWHRGWHRPAHRGYYAAPRFYRY